MPTTGHSRTRPTRRRTTEARKLAGIGAGPGLTREAPKHFNARKVLKETGFRVADEARGYSSDTGSIANSLENIGAGDLLGDVTGLAVVFIGGILGLVLLDLLLGNRGSSIVSDSLKWLGGGVNRLVSPTDPLVGTAAGAVPVAGGANPYVPATPATATTPNTTTTINQSGGTTTVTGP